MLNWYCSENKVFIEFVRFCQRETGMCPVMNVPTTGKITKSYYYLRHVCLSVSTRTHRLSLDIYSWNLIIRVFFENSLNKM